MTKSFSNFSCKLAQMGVSKSAANSSKKERCRLASSLAVQHETWLQTLLLFFLSLLPPARVVAQSRVKTRNKWNFIVVGWENACDNSFLQGDESVVLWTCIVLRRCPTIETIFWKKSEERLVLFAAQKSEDGVSPLNEKVGRDCDFNVDNLDGGHFLQADYWIWRLLQLLY